LDAKLTTLLCKRIIVAKSKEMKTDAIWQTFLSKAVAQEMLFCQ
jgi:hypothetical protein